MDQSESNEEYIQKFVKYANDATESVVFIPIIFLYGKIPRPRNVSDVWWIYKSKTAKTVPPDVFKVRYQVLWNQELTRIKNCTFWPIPPPYQSPPDIKSLCTIKTG